MFDEVLAVRLRLTVKPKLDSRMKNLLAPPGVSSYYVFLLSPVFQSEENLTIKVSLGRTTSYESPD